jgi:hypothetical protein
MDGHSGDVWQLAMHPSKPNIMVGGYMRQGSSQLDGLDTIDMLI